MTKKIQKSSETSDDTMKITVSKNGPYIVTGGVPLKTEEICNDDEGYCRTWKETKSYPPHQQYALCRCGHSKNKPFCDGTQAQIHFDGIEAGDREPYLDGAGIIRGPALTLADNEHLCSHARFCMRAGGIWNLVEQSDNAEARDTAIEESGNCLLGILVTVPALQVAHVGEVPDIEERCVDDQGPGNPVPCNAVEHVHKPPFEYWFCQSFPDIIAADTEQVAAFLQGIPYNLPGQPAFPAEIFFLTHGMRRLHLTNGLRIHHAL